MTLVDVAKAAGVSVATASRALRDRPEVRREVRLRVQEVARQMGYRPNRVAKSLKEGRTRTIGLLLPDPGGNPFYGAVAEAVHHTSRALGYETFVAHFAFTTESFVEVALHADEQQFDGLVIYAPAEYCDEYRRRASPRSAPTVSLHDMGSPADGGIVPCEFEAGRVAGAHLRDLGHRRIAFICAQPSLGPGSRESGFASFAAESGLEARYVSTPEGAEGGKAAVETLLRDKNLPTALVARNDVSAVGALRALHDAGIRVPDEISLMGFDNIELAAHVTPGLTTVDMRTQEAARLLVHRLIGRIEDRVDENPARDLPRPVLVQRESTGPAPGPTNGRS